MGRDARELKRVAGMLLSRLPDLKLEKNVEDMRRRAGRRWRLPAVLRTVLAGLSAGCKSVAEIEALTERMSHAMRRKLGIYRRLPDTTVRDILVRLSPYDLRQSLKSLVHAAIRRGSLSCEGLPFHVVALDGKGTAIENWDHHFAQQKTYDDSLQAYGLVRTVTACLTSTAAKPVIECFPIPAETSESGIFPHVFEALLRSYGDLFRLVTYDAGVPCKENCQLVVDAGKDFFFRVKIDTWFAVQQAKQLLGTIPLEKCLAQTEDVLDNHTSVIRRVFVVKAPRLSVIWKPIKTFVRVHVSKVKDGEVISEEDKYYITSLEADAITPEQWLMVSRGHWGVENNGHWTLDTVFMEDTKPWIVTEPKGTVNVMVLRRIAYTMLAIFRAVTLRSEENRSMPWKRILTWVSDTVISITADQLSQLRQRTGPYAVS